MYNIRDLRGFSNRYRSELGTPDMIPPDDMTRLKDFADSLAEEFGEPFDISGSVQARVGTYEEVGSFGLVTGFLIKDKLELSVSSGEPLLTKPEGKLLMSNDVIRIERIKSTQGLLEDIVKSLAA